MLSDSDFQTELPGRSARAAEEEEGDEAGGSSSVGVRSDRNASVELPVAGALAIGETIAIVFAIGVGVLALALVAAAVRDRFARRERGAEPVVVLPKGPRAAGGAPGGPADPEALASAGLFAEAIRALLLLAVDDVARRRGSAFPAALTSREVLASAALAGDRAQALRGLVLAVERSLFGGAAAGRAEFESARDAARSVTA